MKTNLLLTYLCLIFTFIGMAQQPAKTKSKTKTAVTTNTKTTKVIAQNPVQTTEKKAPAQTVSPVLKINDPSKEAPGKFLCNACAEVDGKIVQMEPNSLLIYDTVCKSYAKAVDFTALDGVWRYEKTYIFSNNHYFVEKIRNYFSEAETVNNAGSTGTVNEAPSFDKMIDDKITAKKQRADKLGRNEVTQQELIMTFDPSVLYKFMNREGEDRDNFAIIKFSKENKLENLTVGEIRFKAYNIAAFKNNYLELFNADYPSINKRFRLLTLNNFSMIIADDANSEIHLFIR